MNNLETYTSFARNPLIKWYNGGEIDLSDFGLNCFEVKL